MKKTLASNGPVDSPVIPTIWHPSLTSTETCSDPSTNDGGSSFAFPKRFDGGYSFIRPDEGQALKTLAIASSHG